MLAKQFTAVEPRIRFGQYSVFKPFPSSRPPSPVLDCCDCFESVGASSMILSFAMTTQRTSELVCILYVCLDRSAFYQFSNILLV